MKTLVVGDIHGCRDELSALIDAAGLSGEDRIVSAGDFLDRGPASPKVFNFFRTQPNAAAVMGNHERKHVRSFAGEIPPALSQTSSRAQFGAAQYPEVISFLKQLPLSLNLGVVRMVHGFFEPGVFLDKQRDVVLVGTLTGEAYLKQRLSRPWYELYDGDMPLVAGHHDYLGTGEPLVWKDRVWCIDTGCVHGGRLTGLLLPDFKLVSVPSRKDYWSEMRTAHAALTPRTLENISADERLRMYLENELSIPEDRMEFRLIEAMINAAAGVRAEGESVQARLTKLIRLYEGLCKDHERIWAQIVGYHVEVLKRIEELGVSYESLSAAEQGKIYGAQFEIVPKPWRRLLQKYRRGQLAYADLPAFLKTSGEIRRLLNEAVGQT